MDSLERWSIHSPAPLHYTLTKRIEQVLPIGIQAQSSWLRHLEVCYHLWERWFQIWSLFFPYFNPITFPLLCQEVFRTLLWYLEIFLIADRLVPRRSTGRMCQGRDCWLLSWSYCHYLRIYNSAFPNTSNHSRSNKKLPANITFLYLISIKVSNCNLRAIFLIYPIFSHFSSPPQVYLSLPSLVG